MTSSKMADDPRPPTAEEISDLRTRLKNHVDENGNGKQSCYDLKIGT